MLPTAETGPFLLGGPNVSWIDAHWMFISGAAAFAIVVCLVIAQKPWREKVHDPLWLAWLCVGLSCWRQFEEHGYDLRGWHYAFLPCMNADLGDLYQEACAKRVGACPLTVRATTYINVGLVWIGFLATIVVVRLWGRGAFALTLNWGVVVVGGLTGHLLPAMKFQTYNPGLFQSIFAVLIGGWVIARCGGKLALLSLVYGTVFHGLFVASAIKDIMEQDSPEELLFGSVICGSFVVPLFLAHLLGPLSPQEGAQTDIKGTSMETTQHPQKSQRRETKARRRHR